MSQISDSPKVGGTLAELADLVGVKRNRISVGARNGKLPTTGVRDASGRYIGVTDLVAAAVEWRRNTDLTKAPPARQAAEFARDQAVDPPPDDDEAEPDEDESEISLANAAAQDKLWAAKKKRLEYLEAAGELVPAADVDRAIVDMITAAKTTLLSIPSRAKQALPHLTHADLAALDGLIRETLEKLAEPSREEIAQS